MHKAPRVPTIELFARNGCQAMCARDNKGPRPPRAKISPDGDDRLPATLLAKATTGALKKAGITAKTSRDAGGYLRNECFYRLMGTPQTQLPAVAPRRRRRI